MPGCRLTIKLYQSRDGVRREFHSHKRPVHGVSHNLRQVRAGKFLGRYGRAPGAEVTHYNNSYGFMSWVVYTLCEPPDNHQPRTIRVLISTFAFSLFTTRRPAPNHITSHILHSASRYRDLRPV